MNEKKNERINLPEGSDSEATEGMGDESKRQSQCRTQFVEGNGVKDNMRVSASRPVL